MNKSTHPAPPSFNITVDVVIFTLHNDKLKVLLISRANEPFKGIHALPGGFLQLDETSAEAATRILRDKAGVTDVYIEQLYTFDSMERDIRGHFPSITYYALVPEEELHIANTDTTQQPELLDAADLPELAFDHDKITNYALMRLRSKLEYTNVAFSLLPDEFTLNQLQATYEAVLGKALDKRNFRKKFLTLGLITATGHKTAGLRHRPAELYQFNGHQVEEMTRWF